MTIYTLLCDLHLSEKTEETFFYILTYVANKIKHDGGRCAILGDLFDTCYKDGKIDGRLQRRLYHFFKEHFTKDTLHMIPGNHDFYASLASEHALVVFEDVATVVTDPTVSSDGILWLPYKEGGYSESFIKSRKREGAKMVFTHNDFKCLMMRRALMSEQGMDPDIFNGLQVYNGHYHYPNTHKIENGFIECIGSQYAVHRSETYSQKYLYDVDTTDGFYKREKIRFGRREFTYKYSEVMEMDKDVWCHNYVHPSKPTTPDHLVILVPPTFNVNTCKLPEHCDASITWRKVSEPVIHHKCVNELNEQMSAFDLVTLAANKYFDCSPLTLDFPKEELVSQAITNFKTIFDGEKNKTIGKKEVEFQVLNMNNFCNVPGWIIVNFEDLTDGTTKIIGHSGAGKTLRYSTALLYCVSGVVDSRFSEDRMLMSDLRCDKSKPCIVSLEGKVNGKPFCIKRIFTGRQTKLMYLFEGKEIKLPTIKATQKAVAKTLFNLNIQDGISPNKLVYDTMIRTIIWKQGGNSNILKLSKDEYTKILLSLVDKSFFLDLHKKSKKVLTTVKKEVAAASKSLSEIMIRIEERKRVTRSEQSGTKAWEIHRRTKLQALEEDLRKLHEDCITNPITKLFDNYETFVAAIANGKKTKDESFIELHSNFLLYEQQLIGLSTLETQINELVQSKEGLRWSPEFTLDHLSTALDDLNKHQSSLKNLEQKVDHWVALSEILQSIIETFVLKMGKRLEENSEILFTNLKILHLKDDTPLKYLSGGQYENHCLKAFLSFINVVKEYSCWSCNLLIFDEPGTHMDTTILQEFIDCLPKDKKNLVITHKNIICDETVRVVNAKL